MLKRVILLSHYANSKLALENFIRERLAVATGVYRGGWIVLIGVFVVAAAAAWLYCRWNGYERVSGAVEAVRNGQGFKIGVKLYYF